MTAQRGRVLLIEDDVDLRDVLRLTLEDHGYEVVEAANGQEGLANLSMDPDVVVLDMVMPLMDGVRFMAAAKLQGRLKCPVLVVTGHNGRAQLMEPLTRVMVKPFTGETLLKAVDELVDDSCHKSEVALAVAV